MYLSLPYNYRALCKVYNILFYTSPNFSVTHLSLECVVRIIKAIDDDHLVISSVLGVDLNEQTESIDSEILPVVATGAVHKASDSLARLLYQSIVGVDAGDRSDTLIRDGCIHVNVGKQLHVHVSNDVHVLLM